MLTLQHERRVSRGREGGGVAHSTARAVAHQHADPATCKKSERGGVVGGEGGVVCDCFQFLCHLGSHIPSLGVQVRAGYFCVSIIHQTDMDYINVRTCSYACVYTRGWSTPTTNQRTILTWKNSHKLFLCSGRDSNLWSSNPLDLFLRPMFYQLSHHIHQNACPIYNQAFRTRDRILVPDTHNRMSNFRFLFLAKCSSRAFPFLLFFLLSLLHFSYCTVPTGFFSMGNSACFPRGKSAVTKSSPSQPNLTTNLFCTFDLTSFVVDGDTDTDIYNKNIKTETSYNLTKLTYNKQEIPVSPAYPSLPQDLLHKRHAAGRGVVKVVQLP